MKRLGKRGTGVASRMVVSACSSYCSCVGQSGMYAYYISSFSTYMG
ncbi:MAG: hypothetical protein H6Q70_1277 [Firmicutes bacterium]|nr:hypothetical protein [Bacillota bacterium]